MNEKDTKYCKYCGDDIHPDTNNNIIYEDTGICIKCDHRNPRDVLYCKKCGANLVVSEQSRKKLTKKKEDIAPDMVLTCSECGHENKGKKFCTKCGAKLTPSHTSK
jgi:ribosomal protein L40E